MQFSHTSVLVNETIELLNIKAKGIYVDCTLGGGGHSAAILAKIDAEGLLIGLDQDLAAVEAAQEKLDNIAKGNFKAVHANFSQLNCVMGDLGITEIDGILFDLGVSSYQLDTAARGFSYMQDAPLDMRMNQRATVSARDLINNLPAEELASIISAYGEERWAKRIAEFIVERRTHGAVETTGQLVKIIKAAIPAGARREGSHPAKRTFQALRIAVNKELDILEQALQQAVGILKKEGRIAVITFHSLEDRIVKDTFKGLARGCICPPNFPVCVCGKERVLEIITKKPIMPTAVELQANPRARSAKLRVAVKR